MKILPLLAILFLVACTAKKTDTNYNDGHIAYHEVMLSAEEISQVQAGMKESKYEQKYDPEEKMLSKTISGWQYHTDSPVGTVVHDVRFSFRYASSLMDTGEKEDEQRAFDILSKTISLQDQDTSSSTCGVWPYYMEEPLATKKTPVDFNWADFNAVTLLDIYMGHESRLPDQLKSETEQALILAAHAIQKRDVKPGYTNIAIMGTYVTYLVSHMFDMPEMQDYAKDRLNEFYEYTLDLGGFSEYNSPTYTKVALDEIARMKSHIVAPEDKAKIDSLYTIGWDMVARHFHQPTMQWTGPQSRAYRNFLRDGFYALLKEATNGKVAVNMDVNDRDVKIKHQLPNHLLHYFIPPFQSRTEIDTFDKKSPEIVGTSYLTEEFALSTANISSMWNQRRPFLAHWGNAEAPQCMQLRFLHNDYDFSSAFITTQQDEGNVLAAVNFSLHSGVKHPIIDTLQDGRFSSKDLRLRFEFGNVNEDQIRIPDSNAESTDFEIDGINFQIQLLGASFNGLEGHWEKGGEEGNAWLDFVLYSGEEREFNFEEMKEAYLCFTYQMAEKNSAETTPNATFKEKDEKVNATWKDLEIEVNKKPYPKFKKFI